LIDPVQEVCVSGGLVVELHREGCSVEQNGHEHGVFTEGRGGKRPQSVLERILWNVSPNRLGFESILDTVPLGRIELVAMHVITVNVCITVCFLHCWLVVDRAVK
jgi:hypothetical protein